MFFSAISDSVNDNLYFARLLFKDVQLKQIKFFLMLPNLVLPICKPNTSFVGSIQLALVTVEVSCKTWRSSYFLYLLSFVCSVSTRYLKTLSVSSFDELFWTVYFTST